MVAWFKVYLISSLRVAAKKSKRADSGKARPLTYRLFCEGTLHNCQ